MNKNEFLEEEDEYQPRTIRDGHLIEPGTNPEEVKISKAKRIFYQSYPFYFRTHHK